MSQISEADSGPDQSLGGSLWLVPEPGSHASKRLQELISRLSCQDEWGTGVSQPFSPHMTITSSITDYFLSSARKVDFPGYSFVHLEEIKMDIPELKVKEIVFGGLFYKRIYIRLQRTESLLTLVRTLRSQFVGESVDALDNFMRNFDPHISLAYAQGFSDKHTDQLKSELEQFATSLDLKEAFQYIVLMDTRSKSSTKIVNNVLEWKACPIRLAM